MNKINLNYV